MTDPASTQENTPGQSAAITDLAKEDIFALTPTTFSSKKGVGAWYFSGIDQGLNDVAVAWVYSWKPRDLYINPPISVQYIPMIWNAADVTTAKLDEAKSTGSPFLLGFNEPDLPEQANMTVDQALTLWPQLEATGLELCSPATSGNPSRSGSWQEQFFAGAKARNMRIDKLCVHWYGTTFDPTQATAQLKIFLMAAYQKYRLPIWLTEFALTRWLDYSNGYYVAEYPSPAIQAEFVRQASAMMEALPFLERYAWFSLSLYLQSRNDTSHLYLDNGTPTCVGEAYRAILKPSDPAPTEPSQPPAPLPLPLPLPPPPPVQDSSSYTSFGITVIIITFIVIILISIT
jgi:hypothetical protein